MRAPLVFSLLVLAGCAATRPGPAPDAEPARLGDLLAALGATPLRPAVEAAGWDALPWTARHAVEVAESRAHFAVAGDEVDVLTYASAREAEGEARRIAESIGDLPLAATEAHRAGPAAYFVVGRTLVRHRGVDSTVAARLTAAYGEPTYLAGDVPALVAGGSAPEAGLQLDGVCYPDNLRDCLGWRPYSEYAYNSLLYHTYRPAFFQTLYQGEHVPAWTVIKRPSAFDTAPPPHPPSDDH